MSRPETEPRILEATADGPAPADGAPHAQAPRPEVEAFVEAFAAGWRNPGTVDAFVAHYARIFHPDVRLVQPQPPVLVGMDEFRSGFAEPLFELMPDVWGEVEGWAATGDVIYLQITLRGTVGGSPLELHSCDRITLRDGRMAERIAFADPLPLVAALLTRPRAWPALARVTARNLRQPRRPGRRS